MSVYLHAHKDMRSPSLNYGDKKNKNTKISEFSTRTAEKIISQNYQSYLRFVEFRIMNIQFNFSSHI